MSGHHPWPPPSKRATKPHGHTDADGDGYACTEEHGPPTLGEVLIAWANDETVEDGDDLHDLLEASLHGIPEPCQECGGSGGLNAGGRTTCPSCHGTGQESRECDGCGGSGKQVRHDAAPRYQTSTCPKCGGSGRLPVLRGGLVERVDARASVLAEQAWKEGTFLTKPADTWVLEALRQELEGVEAGEQDPRNGGRGSGASAGASAPASANVKVERLSMDDVRRKMEEAETNAAMYRAVLEEDTDGA